MTSSKLINIRQGMDEAIPPHHQMGHIPCRWFRVSVRRWHLGYAVVFWTRMWNLDDHLHGIYVIPGFPFFAWRFVFFLNLVSDYFFHKRVVVLPRLKHGNLIWWTDLYWWDGTLAMKRADGLNQIWQLEKLEALTILNMRNTCKIL